VSKKVDPDNTNTIQPVTESSGRYNCDPEYISKVINHFILDSDTQTSTVPRRPAANKHQYQRQHVIDALSKMQLTYRSTYISGETNQINSDEFKSTLLTNIAKQDNVAIPKTMNQIDSRTIDFIEMIFGAFLRDKNTSDVVKNLLLMMQIPIIKIALLDNNFLNNETHIARDILNSIAHLAIGIEDNKSTIHHTIKHIIEQLLHSYDTKPVAFNIAKLSLDRLSEIQKTKHNKTEKQTKNAIAIEYTRQLVLKELQFYTSNINIPETIQPLILNYWSTLMFHRFINHGRESTEWREAVGILRLIVKSFNPIETTDDWHALRSIYKGIINSVNTCLSNSRQNKEKIFIAVSNLNNYYFSKLTHSEFYNEKHKSIKDDTEDNNELNHLNNIYIDESDASPLDIQIENTQNILDAKSDFIKLNNWFEVFTDYNHPVRRLKLSVIVKEHARLIFVDYVGNKVLEKDLNTFLTELQNDQSRLINDHSVFEYALSMVIISIAANN